MEAKPIQTSSLRRDQVLAILTAHQEELRGLGVKSLALFGSVARDDARPDSDVDLLIEFESGRSPRGFAYFGFQEHLERFLGREVDLVEPHLLKSRIRDRILSQAIPIFPGNPSYKKGFHAMADTQKEKDWRLYIDDMLASVEKIHRYTKDLTFEAFQADELRISGVEREIITIGEAAKKMMEEAPAVVQRYPEIPWKEMYGMRIRLVHHYEQTSLEKVWVVAREKASVLAPQLRELLTREEL